MRFAQPACPESFPVERKSDPPAACTPRHSQQLPASVPHLRPLRPGGAKNKKTHQCLKELIDPNLRSAPRGWVALDWPFGPVGDPSGPSQGFGNRVRANILDRSPRVFPGVQSRYLATICIPKHRHGLLERRHGAQRGGWSGGGLLDWRARVEQSLSDRIPEADSNLHRV